MTASSTITSLKRWSKVNGVPYQTARRQAMKGRLPAWQVLGPGSSWLIREDIPAFNRSPESDSQVACA